MACLAWQGIFWHLPTSDQHGFTWEVILLGPDSSSGSPGGELLQRPGGAWVPSLLVGGPGRLVSTAALRLPEQKGVGRNKASGLSFPRESQPSF